MTHQIDVSIIIPVYNSALSLNRCLDSVFSQTDQYSIEVILIDDGCTDDSVDIIKKRQEKNIRLLQQQNAGPAAARNRGIEIAEGEFLAFLDADDYWLPGFIEQTVSFLKIHKEAIAVSVGQKHITITDEHISPSIISEMKESIVLDDYFDFWVKHSHVCTGSAMMRTETVQKTGGQCVNLRICEDLEFWAYLATFGKWGIIPEILFASDGNTVTSEIGWLNKCIPRWNSAIEVEVWERRIIKRMTYPLTPGYLKFRSKMARSLCYPILLSNRISMARRQVLRYGRYFPHDKLSVLLRISCKSKMIWYVVAKFLIYREFHRKIKK